MSEPLSSFDTPVELAVEIARALPLFPGARVLEPHVGAGNWLYALAQVSFERQLGLVVEVMDLDPLAPGYELAADPPRGLDRVIATPCAPSDDAVRNGFLVTDPQAPPDLIVGNPPYNVIPPLVGCERCEGHGVLPATTKAARARGETRACPDCGGTCVAQPPKIAVAALHVARACELAPSVTFLLKIGFLASQARRKLYAEHPLAGLDVVRPRPKFKGRKADNTEYAVFSWDRTWDRGYFQGGFRDWTPAEPDGEGEGE